MLYWFCGPICPSIGDGSQVGHQTVIPTLSTQSCQSAAQLFGQFAATGAADGRCPRLSCRRCNPRGIPPALREVPGLQ